MGQSWQWKKRNPDHQPLKCHAGFHLWRHGLALAIYLKAGELTNGGDESRVFNTKRETLQKFYGAHYNAVLKAVNHLIKEGWLVPTEEPKEYKWLHHDTRESRTGWAEKHPGRCQLQNLMPYQEEADPLVKELFAIAHGKLKIKEHWLVGMRKLASDELIVELFKARRDFDIRRRKTGDPQFTAPHHSLYAVFEELNRRNREQ